MQENIIVKVGADISNLSRNLKQASEEVSGFGKRFSALGKTIARASAVAGAAFGAVGVAIGKVGIEYNAMQEQSTVAWTTLLGSAKEAKDMLKRISDFAKSTPFETEDVDMMAKYMHNAGLAGDELFRSLMRISDVSSAFAIPAADAREMARQMSQVMQAGVAYTEDLNILQDRGVPIYKAISEQLGVTVADVKKLAEQGKLTSDIYISAFNSIAKGVEGASKAQSQTFNGMISTLKDNVKILAGSLTEGLFGTVKGGLSNILSLLEDFNAGLQKGGLKGAFEAILPPSVFERLQTFVTGFMNVFNTIKSFVVPILTEVGAFILAKINELKAFWDENGAQIIEAVRNFWAVLTAIFKVFSPVIKFIVQTLWGAVKDIVNGALNGIMGLVKIFTGLFTGDFRKMWEGIKQLFRGAIYFITGLMTLNFFGGIKKILTNLLKNGISIVKNLWTNIVNMFKNAGTNATNTVSGIVTRVVAFFGNLFTKAKNIFTTLRTFGASIWNALKEAVLGAARAIWQGVVSRFSSMASSVRNLMHNVKSAIINIWNQAVKFLKSVDLKSIGRNIIRGLIKGITGMASAVWDAVKDVGNKIKNGFKSFFGIKSPSRLMADLARWIPAGAIKGIESMQSDVLKTAQKLSEWMTPEVPEVSLAYSYSTPAGMYRSIDAAVAGTVDVTASSADNREILTQIYNELRRQRNLIIQMDRREVGRLVAPVVNEEIGQRYAIERRFRGIR